jgi:ankyrin repeat protein
MNLLKVIESDLPADVRYNILSKMNLDELVEASNKYEQVDKYFDDPYFLVYYIKQNSKKLTFEDIEYLLDLFGEILDNQDVTPELKNKIYTISYLRILILLLNKKTRVDLIKKHPYLELMTLYENDGNISKNINLYKDINYRRKILSNAFYEAIRHNDINYGILDMLLYLGAQVNMSYNHPIWNSPLIMSSINKDPNLTLYLLENGADPNHVDRNGYTPLIHSVIPQKEKMFDPYGDWTQKSKEYQFDAYNTAKYLLEYGANPMFIPVKIITFRYKNAFLIAVETKADKILINLLKESMASYIKNNDIK